MAYLPVIYLKVSRHPPTVPIAEEQMLKHISLWGAFDIQNIATSSINGGWLSKGMKLMIPVYDTQRL